MTFAQDFQLSDCRPAGLQDTPRPQKPTIIYADDPRRQTGGVENRFDMLATGAETDGQYLLMEATIAPGGHPPKHIQTREEEMFYILSGTLTFHADGQEVIARPGTFLNIPKNVEHWFENVSDAPAKMLVLFAPAGLEGWFEAATRSPEKMREIGETNYGLKFVEDD